MIVPSIGDRIKLLVMTDDPDPIEPGATGTVRNVVTVQSIHQVRVDWDNGRKLGLCIPPDQVIRIAEETT